MTLQGRLDLDDMYLGPEGESVKLVHPHKVTEEERHMVQEQPEGTALTLRAIQEINRARKVRWHSGESRPWSTLEWAGAMTGEAGEAANVAKKILRLDLGIKGNESSEHVITERAELVEKLAGEIAGTMLYLSLLADSVGIDMERAVIECFNAKSVAMGFPERLGEPWGKDA